MANLKCKICNGRLLFLGQLGYLRNFTCRHCGMSFSQSPKIVRDEFDRIISVKY